MIFANGDLYEGYWVNNIFTGKGFLIKPNGYSCFGTFANNKPNGVCTETYDDGTVYKGNLAYGTKHGRGTFDNESLNYQYKGDWNFGFKEGRGKEVQGNV